MALDLKGFSVYYPFIQDGWLYVDTMKFSSHLQKIVPPYSRIMGE